MRKLYPARWIVLAVWLGSWIYVSRYAMLDDALIHLRYAAFLKQLHFITYDGVHRTYGTSSLLFVCLLAALRSVTTSVMLPKALSVVSYLLLLLVLLLLGRRSAPGRPPRFLWLGLLLTTLSPMGVRWLTDGMETSMVLLAVVLTAWIASLEQDRGSATFASYLTVLLFGAALVLLRVELASLAVLASCAVMAMRLQATRRLSWPVLHGTALAAGSFLALIGMRLVLGSFLPDTALAKSGLPWDTPLAEVPAVIASSMILGIGSLVLAVLSASLLLQELVARRPSALEFAAWASANVPLPLVVLLACLRGQGIQGVRYVLWPLLFSTAWNALEWDKSQHARDAAGGPLRWAAWGYAVMLVCLLPFDWRFAHRAMAGRANTFEAMRNAGLDRFRGLPLLAGDVGFIGYFSGADVCDLNGLVNGRDAARLSEWERIHLCVSRHPQVLFLSAAQASDVGQVIPLGHWLVCEQVDFTNARGGDRHYLMVPREAAPSTCPGDSSSVPVAEGPPRPAGMTRTPRLVALDP